MFEIMICMVSTMAIVLYAGATLWLTVGTAMFAWDAMTMDVSKVSWEPKLLLLLGASMFMAALMLTLTILVLKVF